MSHRVALKAVSQAGFGGRARVLELASFKALHRAVEILREVAKCIVDQEVVAEIFAAHFWLNVLG